MLPNTTLSHFSSSPSIYHSPHLPGHLRSSWFLPLEAHICAHTCMWAHITNPKAGEIWGSLFIAISRDQRWPMKAFFVLLSSIWAKGPGRIRSSACPGKVGLPEPCHKYSHPTPYACGFLTLPHVLTSFQFAYYSLDQRALAIPQNCAKIVATGKI